MNEMNGRGKKGMKICLKAAESSDSADVVILCCVSVMKINCKDNKSIY